MAARTRKIRHDENTREKIRTSQLINRLESHVFGKIEMAPSQVSAALGLLRKTLPDLSQSDVTQTVKRVRELSDNELSAIVGGDRSSEGVDAATVDPSQLN